MPTTTILRLPAILATAALVAATSGTGLAAEPICGDLNGSGGLSSTDAQFALRAAVGQDVDLKCPAAATPLRTGQNTCYDSTGNAVVCTNTGQDAALAQGATRSFTDNGNGTITDHATGLMWEKLSDDGSSHDFDFSYLWATAYSLKIAQLNSLEFAGYTDWRLPNRFELDTLVNLGAAHPATHPEFHSGCTPGCTVLTCSCTKPESYWSSTSDEASPVKAWSVRFNHGYTDSNPKGAEFHVRGVRGGTTVDEGSPVCGDTNLNGVLASSDALLILKKAVGQDVTLGCPVLATPPRTGQSSCHNAAGDPVSCTGTRQDADLRFGIGRSFTDNGDGTITDHATGLMWEKQSDDDSIHDVDNTFTIPQALLGRIPLLNSMSFAGHSDWRLPNRFELDTIVNLGAPSPTTFSEFDSGCTPGCTVLECSCTSTDYYWASTTTHAFAERAWSVLFDRGHSEWSNKGDEYRVRAVRSAN